MGEKKTQGVCKENKVFLKSIVDTAINLAQCVLKTLFEVCVKY